MNALFSSAELCLSGAATERIHSLLPYDTAAEITYRYEPRTLNDNSDRSDLDDGLLGLVVNYVVGRERLGGDVSTQSGGNIYLAMFEAGKAKLRGYIRDDDSFRIVNRY